MRRYVRRLLHAFHRLPLPLMLLHVSAKSLSSFGMGAALAARRKTTWRLVGGLALLTGVLMAVPSAVKVFQKMKEAPEAA